MRVAEERTFRTFDGTELFYRYWPATSGTPRGAIALFHRGHEHSGRVAHLVDELGLDDFAFFAWDARGHGRSPGPRGYSPSLAASVRDVDTFIDEVCRHAGVAKADVSVIAQSVGAVIVATWLHDYAPKIRCAVLASPAFKVKLYVPLARRGLAVMEKFRGNFFVKSYVKSKFLTHDAKRIASFDTDPLITRDISVNILLDLYKAADRVVADAQAITVPLQLLISGSDFVVHHQPQHEFFNNLGSMIKERHVLRGFFHDTLGERDREQALVLVRRFIRQRYDTVPAPVVLTVADKIGPTRQEADRLATPLPVTSPRGLLWAATRASIRAGGMLSRGLKLGRDTGFDSGSTLDFVYRNEPVSRTRIGRLIDRQYLNAIGWRGIRQRKVHVEELVRDAMRRLRDAGTEVRIMDVAAGHGRYVLDAIESSDVKPASILLRDYSDINVTHGRELIASRRLDAIARFMKGDAFNRDDLAAVTPKPTLAIVSGLYELFGDNGLVSRSLDGIAA
ncbi:MAG TPA: bifunctional alpha/beta hydrolase/class I SAM-dependent methyltransferase, partial [Thermoanaerobaculia bacterium]|nr:bifunctional alpha/beta hydrolase/class I SAM-dependent methyltransferase [Thermoanaerobaculia bacterium]